MSRRCRAILYTMIGCFAMVVLVLLIKLLFFSGLFVPMLKLQGDKVMEVAVNTTFKDPGIKAHYHFSNIGKQVVTTSNINMKKLGVYTITYTAAKLHRSIQRTVHVVDTTPPIISLKGDRVVRVFVNGTYKEAGVKAMDGYDGDITKNVHVDNKVNMKKTGTYSIIYRVKDSSGNETSCKREVQVCEDPTSTKLFYDYGSYDNTMEEWWFRKSEHHQRTTGAKAADLLQKYGTYFQGPDEKVIYLTFDEGGNDITYIKEIAKVLKKDHVHATYFLTRNYIKSNPKFINTLVKDGNVIGNHTWHHYDMTKLANAQSVDKFVREITETEKTYMEVTGQKMKKIFRFPKGGSSERAMKMVHDLGYTIYDWSHAYYDFAGNVSGDEALKTMLDHYHNGAIYLLHPSNLGNYEAIDTFIHTMQEKGYQFKTVDTIPASVKK